MIFIIILTSGLKKILMINKDDSLKDQSHNTKLEDNEVSKNY